MEERIRSFFSEYGLILVLAGSGIVFLVFGILKLTAQSDPVIISSDSSSPSIAPEKVFVDIAGAVKQPGMYSMPSTARVADVIKKAGGITAEADSNYVSKTLNRAQNIKDGQKIFIPFANQSDSQVSTTQDVAGTQTELVNINTASIEQLDTLPGVGEVTAQKIISNRPYTSIEELKNKKSVTNSTFEKIKDLVAVY